MTSDLAAAYDSTAGDDAEQYAKAPKKPAASKPRTKKPKSPPPEAAPTDEQYEHTTVTPEQEDEARAAQAEAYSNRPGAPQTQGRFIPTTDVPLSHLGDFQHVVDAALQESPSLHGSRATDFAMDNRDSHPALGIIGVATEKGQHIPTHTGYNGDIPVGHVRIGTFPESPEEGEPYLHTASLHYPKGQVHIWTSRAEETPLG